VYLCLSSFEYLYYSYQDLRIFITDYYLILVHVDNTLVGILRNIQKLYLLNFLMFSNFLSIRTYHYILLFFNIWLSHINTVSCFIEIGIVIQKKVNLIAIFAR